MMVDLEIKGQVGSNFPRKKKIVENSSQLVKTLLNDDEILLTVDFLTSISGCIS